MITAEFMAGKTGPQVFRVQQDDKGGFLPDTVECPLVLHMPHMDIRKDGTDKWDKRVREAVQKMVDELNG